MRTLLTLWLAATSLLLTSCATLRSDPELLKSTLESFHSRARWKDFRGAAELLVPERRDAFEKARRAGNDEKDLSISDFQLEDARLAPDALSATAVSRMSWFRLPSASEQSATLTSHLVWRDGRWLIDWQDAGPFAEELKPR